MLLIHCVRALRCRFLVRHKHTHFFWKYSVSVQLCNISGWEIFSNLAHNVIHVQMIADPAFAQPPSESEERHNVRPQSPSSHCPGSPIGHPKPLGDTLRPKEPPPPAVYPDKARGPSEAPIAKKSSSLLNSLRPPLPLQAKEGPHTINGRTKPWDSFTPEEFAQQFHESVLQSTQKALQRHKGKLYKSQ